MVSIDSLVNRPNPMNAPRGYVRFSRGFGPLWALLVLLAAGDLRADDAPTFYKDVTPIFQAKCNECHRPGGIAPMSLVTFEQARPWAAAIRKEVTAKRMPPFHADGPAGYYKDDIRLTPDEIQTIAEWVDAGVPQGNAADQPTPKPLSGGGWALGEPDLVVTLPGVSPRSDNLDDWWTLHSDHVFAEDTWYRGVQVRVENGSSIHHAHLLVTHPGDEIPEGGVKQDKIDVQGHQPIETWFPGLAPYLLPEGVGAMIPKGSRLALQVHFGPTSEGKREQPAIGLYLAHGKIHTAQAFLGGGRVTIDIPPHAADHTIRTTNTFKVSGTITHFRNHMHLRGKSAQILLRYPDGTSELVFDLPRFNFDWQRYYFLAQPKRVPAGTVAEFIGTWDNSADNPLNPDPTQRVGVGFRTTDEMFGTKLFYTPDIKLPKTYQVENGRVIQATDNPNDSPWIVFWNQVIDRKVLEDAIAQQAVQPEP